MENFNIDIEAQQFGEMLEPIAVIASDDEIKEAFKNESILKAAAIIFKKHPAEAVDFILAYYGETREATDLNRKNMFGRLIKILNDKDILSAFTSAE